MLTLIFNNKPSIIYRKIAVNFTLIMANSSEVEALELLDLSPGHSTLASGLSGVSELIRRVQNRSILWDPRHKEFKERNTTEKLWREVADGLEIDLGVGVEVNAKNCKLKWRKLRDYYYKVKKTLKGKSGDARKQGKLWEHFKEMDQILVKCPYENAETISNLDLANESTDPEITTNESPDVGTETPSRETTPTQVQSSGTSQATPRTTEPCFRVSKKRRPNPEANDSVDKLLELIQSTEKQEDRHFHFGMTVAATLRELPSVIAAEAKEKIQTVLSQAEKNAANFVQ